MTELYVGVFLSGLNLTEIDFRLEHHLETTLKDLSIIEKKYISIKKSMGAVGKYIKKSSPLLYYLLRPFFSINE
jgi:hypothetical protein